MAKSSTKPEDSISEKSDSKVKEEQEDPSEYENGGYHPLQLGSLLNEQYYVIRKCGWGHFSTVWLCFDISVKRFAAIKIVKSAKHFTETALDEIKLLQKVNTCDSQDPCRKRIVELYDNFRLIGPNGLHVCMVFEVLGRTTLKSLKKSQYRGLPLVNVRQIIKQVLEALAYLHSKCKIIHTDVKPENVLFCMTDEAIKNLALRALKKLNKGEKLPKNARPSNEFAKLEKNKNKEKIKAPAYYFPFKESNAPKSVDELEDISLQSAKETSDNLDWLDDQQSAKTSSSNSSLEELSCPEDAEMLDKLKRLVDWQDTQPFVESEEDQALNNLDNIMHQQSSSKSSGEKLANGQKIDNLNLIKEIYAIDKTPNSLTIDDQQDALSPGSEIQVKLADLGNACWTNNHYSDDIQTRQYRAIEVILGYPYDCPVDVWSVACTAFELATGDYLFDPKDHGHVTKNEEHVASIVNMLGSVPKLLIDRGKFAKEYFFRGKLKYEKSTAPISLKNVLQKKYCWDVKTAEEFCDFLLPMLHLDPAKRATAEQCLQHPWLNVTVKRED